MKALADNFTSGLFLSPPPDRLPPGAMVRNRGIHPLAHTSARTRFGSSLLYPSAAHSLRYFADNWHYGVSTSFYRDTELIRSDLSSSRLSFAAMPPIAGLSDYLFVAGGGTLFKIDSSGAYSAWGIPAPASGPTLGLAAGGNLENGFYRYQITYYCSATGHRSNGNGTDVTTTTGGGNNTVNLTAMPGTDMGQVDFIEIWRSVASGNILFYLTAVPNPGGGNTASYTDANADSTLTSVELPTDNLPPYSWFSACAGPFNASMFWITRTEPGQRGRVYYSPVGRPEAVEGFLNITNDSDPLQAIVSWAGRLGVISQSRVFEITGDNPYTFREVSGVPGSNAPYTVSLTPYGVLYEAADGVRVCDGNLSPLAYPDAVAPIFRGESRGALTSFSGVVAIYARGEYFISDTAQTLALNLEKGTWRDLGVGCNALAYDPENDVLAATISDSILALETEGTTQDASTPIPISWEPAHAAFDAEAAQFIDRLVIDASTSGVSLTPTLLLDNSSQALAPFSNAARGYVEYDVSRVATRAGLRITGSATAAVELFSAYISTTDILLILNLGHDEASRDTLTFPGRIVSSLGSLRFDIIDSSPLLTSRHYLIVERLALDIHTYGRLFTLSLAWSNATDTIAEVQTDARELVSISVNSEGRLRQVTLDGDFSQPLAIHRVELDAYISGRL